MSSQRHKQRVLVAGQKHDAGDDMASSIMSSTFSLGDPIATDKDSVDSDAEEEFHEVIEGLKKTGLEDTTTPSPVKRPSNPHPSAQQGELRPFSPEDGDGASTRFLTA
jgi:pre-60S factor REI1